MEDDQGVRKSEMVPKSARVNRIRVRENDEQSSIKGAKGDKKEEKHKGKKENGGDESTRRTFSFLVRPMIIDELRDRHSRLRDVANILYNTTPELS